MQSSELFKQKELSIDSNKPTKELEWIIRTLFDLIDIDSSGVITLEKALTAYHNWDLPADYAQELLRECANENHVIEFSNFLKFFFEKEKKIKELFHRIDTENDGRLKTFELKIALEREGVCVTIEELERFVSFIDRDRNGVVTYDEWRDFLLLFPLNTNISAVYGVIFSDPLVDIGESVIIPEGISLQQIGKYFVAGGIAGASSRTVTAPLDRLKVLLQVQSSKNPKYKGIINGFRTIYKESGITGFWRGNGINVLKIAPETAVKFFSYEQVKKWLNADSEQISIKMRLISGGLAGLTAQAAVYPLEVLKTRLITQEKRLGLVKTFTGILKKEGLVAFFQGIKPALLGVVPFAALDLSVFESLKRSYMNRRDRHPNALVTLACGTVSSAIAVTAVYPLSLVRTRLQAQSISNTPNYENMLDVFKKTYKYEGLLGFYKGLAPNLFKVVPAAGISYVVFESCKSRLHL